jgi:hypothetical protein
VTVTNFYTRASLAKHQRNQLFGSNQKAGLWLVENPGTRYALFFLAVRRIAYLGDSL